MPDVSWFFNTFVCLRFNSIYWEHKEYRTEEKKYKGEHKEYRTEEKKYRTEDIQKKEREEPQAYPNEEGSPKRNKAKNKTGGQPFFREQEGERAEKQGNEGARKQSSEKQSSRVPQTRRTSTYTTPTHHDSTALPA